MSSQLLPHVASKRAEFIAFIKNENNWTPPDGAWIVSGEGTPDLPLILMDNDAGVNLSIIALGRKERRKFEEDMETIIVYHDLARSYHDAANWLTTEIMRRRSGKQNKATYRRKKDRYHNRAPICRR